MFVCVCVCAVTVLVNILCLQVMKYKQIHIDIFLLVEDFNGSRYQSGSFSLVIVGSGLRLPAQVFLSLLMAEIYIILMAEIYILLMAVIYILSMAEIYSFNG